MMQGVLLQLHSNGLLLLVSNSLHNFNGFSANQLVFGFNPAFPSIYSESFAVFECRTSSEIVTDNLNAVHAACKTFIINESSEKICRALLHNVRANDVENVQHDDLVYYKQNDDGK